MDLVVEAEQESASLTIIERSRNFFIQTKLHLKKPADVEEAVNSIITAIQAVCTHITTDNGVEFMNHKKYLVTPWTVPFISQTRIAQGKRAPIEKLNKILREYFPKGT